MATQEVTQLKKDIEALKGDIHQLSNTIKELAQEKAIEGKSKMFEELHIDDLKEQLDNLKTKGKDGLGAVESEIKTHPLQSTAISFGVGFLIALMMNKK
ncbi:DUF883 C-terminal domain-containing protein [Hydrogenovibrio sp. 3SP14C1]|uniref:DUF883 family protein n=1 Tax=Hydrogenovibrio sp. 3SP14C1 TaxID=3038774 RepID=UPI00241750C5|nr:DUF883 C-terminal domain-containing protein [Hydrogenovibrio sp. 3SP14C1]MDG4812392.1 DUF883 C-terminal domain-containing protein [Hydrogenovibrio sp. 3SP14C1]